MRGKSSTALIAVLLISAATQAAAASRRFLNLVNLVPNLDELMY